jgi:hypothetical protein
MIHLLHTHSISVGLSGYALKAALSNQNQFWAPTSNFLNSLGGGPTLIGGGAPELGLTNPPAFQFHRWSWNTKDFVDAPEYRSTGIFQIPGTCLIIGARSGPKQGQNDDAAQELQRGPIHLGFTSTYDNEGQETPIDFDLYGQVYVPPSDGTEVTSLEMHLLCVSSLSTYLQRELSHLYATHGAISTCADNAHYQVTIINTPAINCQPADEPPPV